MAITTFVANQILTAAQMNAVQGNDYNQTVSTKTASYTLVAADKGTRIVMDVTGASTVTVNTSLFSAGDTLTIQNISATACTVTAGTATVSSAGPLAIPQNGSGLLYFTSAGVSIFYPSAVTATASGLVLINSTAFSSATSFSLPNSTFTSTYENYMVQFNTAASATGGNMTMRFRAASSDITGADYYNAAAGHSASNNAITIANNGTTSASLGFLQDTSVFTFGFQIYISRPTATTGVKNYRFHNNSAKSDFGSIGFITGGGVLNSTTACDSLTIINSVASSMTGTVRVYGFANS